MMDQKGCLWTNRIDSFEQRRLLNADVPTKQQLKGVASEINTSLVLFDLAQATFVRKKSPYDGQCKINA